MTPGMLARAGWPVLTRAASPMKIPPSSRLVSGPAPAIRASAAGPGVSQLRPPEAKVPHVPAGQTVVCSACGYDFGQAW